MTDPHPNVALLSQLDLSDLAGAADLFAEGFVWHFFNPMLPGIEGDYVGLNGLRTFFERIGGTTNGTFKINPVSATPIGDELVVVHVKDSMTLDDTPVLIDAVVVWRFVNAKIAEAWDIPAVHTLATPAAGDTKETA
ncbi:nuclear transport factor 2 family protein [Fontisubflavum oceani]|uniref:nuclear transport factor 2 family protein n=1 Tax=Fontisubflavum oceani TaxID=2978973 RepID=UPI0025B2A3D4|nr:nuclear transport factor 2 family protein [Fontisubflavum oceani]WJY23177.1 nuclear transport factor 2 family protein [Fontisubflavum oceani]